MRLKFNVDIRQQVLVVYRRITLSKLTLFYFLFSLVHSIIQVLFQGQAYEINASAAKFIHGIVIAANSTTVGFPVLQGDTLSVCSSIDPLKCNLVWSLVDGNQTYAKGIETSSEDLSYSVEPPSTKLASPVSSSAQPIVTSLSQPTSLPVASTQKAAVPTASLPRVVDDDDDDDDDEEDDDDESEEEIESDDEEIDTRRVRKRSPPASLSPFHDSNPTTESSLALSKLNTFGSGSKRSLHLKVPLSFPLRKRGGLDTSTTMLVSPADKASKTGAATQIELFNLPNSPSELVLDQQCLVALNWPLEVLHNTQREDITFIFFHIWVFGMSMAALLNESVVHMLASLLTHVIVTAWSAFQLGHTKTFQNNFQKIITQGSCDGQNLLPTYWKDRATAEIPAAVFNAVALIVSAFLTYRLIKTFSWATFKRIGASRQISRVYKFVLSLSVLLQLGLFFIVVSMALWIDQICSGLISMLVVHMTLYKGVYITVMLLLVPWIVVGWKAVRLEHRRLMHVFLAFNVVLVGGWAAMFSSITFRYLFTQWAFFRLMWIAAVILIFGILIFGVICRRNFGMDLNRFLNSQSKIEDEEDFVSAYPAPDYPGEVSRKGSIASSVDSYGNAAYGDEKIDFPSSNAGSVPTFGAMFPAVSRTTSNSSSVPSMIASNSPVSSITSPQAAKLPPSRFSDSEKSLPPSYVPKDLEANRISISSAHSVSSIAFGPVGAKSGRASPASSPVSGQKYGGRSKKWVIE